MWQERDAKNHHRPLHKYDNRTGDDDYVDIGNDNDNDNDDGYETDSFTGTGWSSSLSFQSPTSTLSVQSSSSEVELAQPGGTRRQGQGITTTSNTSSTTTATTTTTVAVEISVGGMTCSMCSDAVKKALMAIPGIIDVSVSLATNIAHIEYDTVSSSSSSSSSPLSSSSTIVTPQSIADEIEAIGYDVTDIVVVRPHSSSSSSTGASTASFVNTLPLLRTVELAVGGMTCSMCSSAVHKALVGIKGVQCVTVSLSTNIARIDYFEDSDQSNPQAFRGIVEDIGYDVNDLIVIVGGNNKASKMSVTTNTPLGRKIVELSVGGMTCTMCSSAVHKALIGMPGVISVDVSLSTNMVRIAYEENDEYNPESFREMVEDIGYDVNEMVVVSVVESPSLFSSNTTIQMEEEDDEPDDRLGRILRQQDGQLRERRTDFLWSLAGVLPIMTITMIIPNFVSDTHCIRQFLQTNIIFMGHTLIVQAVIVWLLATPVQFVCGYSFYKTSYHGIRRGVLGMDVLVALGTTASYLYAFTAMLGGDEGYRFFETSAVLICFVLLGKWMNASAVRRTSEALTQLMKLQARTAIKVSSDDPKHGCMETWNPLQDSYSEEVVSIQNIHPGDVVKILKGASIPADGVVLHGELTVDQSMITGESIPVLKVPGDEVLGGTICSETGTTTTKKTNNKKGSSDALTAAAFVRVTGVGADSALSRIVQLVQEAQSRQVPIQNLADSIASIFVPVVVCLALLTFLFWYSCCAIGIVPVAWHKGESPATFSLLFGIACLVISCPCALGLATPTAVMVGTGVGASHGILMKGGETLEVASKVNVVVFDKTGTLTKGKPAVTDFIRVLSDEVIEQFMDPLDSKLTVEDYLVWCLGSLERNSEHVLASAIVKYAEQKIEHLLETKAFSQPSNFVALTGRGASGTIDGTVTIAIGNRSFAERECIEISADVEVYMQELEKEGKTAVVAGINGTVCAVLGIADELKDEAVDSVRYLQTMGMDVWMVTGDSTRTAAAIARQLDLPGNRVIAEALPNSKVEQVRTLQSEGYIVAMVGDGVNDSPALAEADVGISMGTGAEIATEASDMVLVSGRIGDTCTALHLSRVIFRRIQWNLLFSMVYNVLSIPIAAGVFFPIFHTRLPPTVAALAMALSSVSVVGSSLALRLYKPPNVSSTQSRTSTQHVRSLTRPGRDRPLPEIILRLGRGLVGAPHSQQTYRAVSNYEQEQFDEETEFQDEIV
jgi:Cu+-exporting ATPase